jgi:hypothetical protein
LYKCCFSIVILSIAKNLFFAACCETLHGVYAERDSSVAPLLQNDSEGFRVTTSECVQQTLRFSHIIRAREATTFRFMSGLSPCGPSDILSTFEAP